MLDAERLSAVRGEIVDSAVRKHREDGPGLLESVYEVLLAHEFRERGLDVERQEAIAMECRGIRFDEGYRLDPVVGGLVIGELKSVEKLEPVHSKQLLTNLRLAGFPPGDRSSNSTSI